MAKAPTIGYIKLYRSLMDWEWYDDDACLRVLIHLMISVNWEQKQWHGQTIEPGQVVTSMEAIAGKLRLSRSAVRRAMDKLKSTGEIAIQTNNHWTTVTLANWAEYQVEPSATDRQTGQQTTDQRPTTDRPAATTKEEKKLRREEGKNSSPNGEGQAHGDPRINEVIAHFEATMGTPPDDSQKWARIHCANLLKWMEKTHPEPDALTNVKALITAVKVDPFHGKNARSFKYLYQYRSPIVEAAKQRKQSTKNLTPNEYGQAVAAAAEQRLRDRQNNAA